MEIFKQLKKLGYKHYIDLTIEELDALPIDNIEKRIECSLIIDWLREIHQLHIEIQSPDYPFEDLFTWTIHKVKKFGSYGDGSSEDYYKAREQAILKTIELCQNKK